MIMIEREIDYNRVINILIILSFCSNFFIDIAWLGILYQGIVQLIFLL